MHRRMRWENGALVQGRTMQNPCRSLALRAPLAVEDSLLALRRLGFEPPDPADAAITPYETAVRVSLRDVLATERGWDAFAQ